jgi:hypothetical protein
VSFSQAQLEYMMERGLTLADVIELGRLAPEPTPDPREAKRAADRERMRAKREVSRDCRATVAATIPSPLCPPAFPPHPLTTPPISPQPFGGGGGASASEIETTDDWPEGKAQDHARLIVAEVASPRLDPMKSPGLVTTAGRLMAWKRDGASWEHDVIPVVASVCARQRGPVSTWKFFDQAIARSMADNRAALEIPSAGEGRRATGPPMSLTDRIAAEHAESRRMALEMLAAENGPTN